MPPDDMSGTAHHALARLSQDVNSLAARHGLGRADVAQLVRSASTTTDTARVIDDMRAGVATADTAAVRETVLQLEDALDEVVDKRELTTRQERLLRRVTALVGIVVGAVCILLVAGGLVEGDGALGAPAGLFAFTGVLVTLGVFEALHVAGVQIRRADLAALQETHPRAIRLHSRLRDEEGIDRFLAGRQIVVILTVFFVAPLVTFPNLNHLPLTHVGLPTPIRPAVTLVGIPGAFFVLWFGQLLPQFVATRLPLTLLDSRVGWVACRLALFLGGTGLAQPGFWSARLFRGKPQRIPSSGRFRWDQAVRDMTGWGVIGVVRRWGIEPGVSRVAAQTSIRISQPHLTHIGDRSMLLTASPRTLAFECQCTDAVGHYTELLANELTDETLLTGDRRFHKILLPAIGSFAEGSLLRLDLEAEFSGDVLSDIVHVEHPTRYLLFRVEARARPSHFPPARLTLFAVGDGLTDLRQVGEPLSIDPTIGPDGLPRIEHRVSFPSTGTLYRLDWDVSWR